MKGEELTTLLEPKGTASFLENPLRDIVRTGVPPVADGSALLTNGSSALELQVTFLLAVEADRCTSLLLRAVVGTMTEQSAL